MSLSFCKNTSNDNYINAYLFFILNRYYDSIYTERYMLTPVSNPSGYENSAITNMTGFEHAKFLLVHGTGDGK